MWRNYLTVGLRALAKNRTYAFITIFGLAVGMAACLMILLFVRYELSYDEWIPNAENVYQVQTWSEEEGSNAYLQMTPYVVGRTLQKDFPQVERQVYALKQTPVFLHDGQPSLMEDVLFVDGNLLDVVPLPLAAGDSRALDALGQALITESEARRRYGTDRVLGRTMPVISKGITFNLRIAGVLKDLPRSSHMKIAAIARMDLQALMKTEPQFLTCWACSGGWVYVALAPGSDPAAIERALPAWEKRNIPDEGTGDARFNAGDLLDWHLANVRDVHLGRAQAGAMKSGNDRQTIATFAIVAVLILAMALINFTNLATARAGQRAREVALRKVLGATRSQLIFQFIGESMLIASAAMLCALAAVELVMPAYAEFLGADLKLSYFGADGVALPALVLVVIAGFLGGIYPALFLARFQPAAVLKANKSAAEAEGSGRLRAVLVVAQFAVSIGLIICTAVIYAQTVYARTSDPGFDRERIMQVDGMNRYQLMNLGNPIVEAVRRVPGVTAVGRTDIGIATPNNNSTGVIPAGGGKPISIGVYMVDHGLLPAMGLRLTAGRWFDAVQPHDDMTPSFPLSAEDQKGLVSRGGNVVINELAARRLGFARPADAVGRTVRAALVENKHGLVPVRIVGVVKDARFRSVRAPLEPIIFLNGIRGQHFMIVRYSGDRARVASDIERIWRRFTRQVPFEARFSDAIVHDLYKAEDARAKIFAAFACLSVVVACLGLFGLAAFTAERRTKEIGIRKVLGARTSDIVRLLTWQFSKPVILANLIAWPVAGWTMHDWLNGFDARIALRPLPFVAASVLALAIALLTIASHAIRVARANPIHALRYE